MLVNTNIQPLLRDPIAIASQYQHDNSNNPCTGVAFACISNKDVLAHLFTRRDWLNYPARIHAAIESAILRKQTDLSIPPDGESLLEPTVVRDFKEIHDMSRVLEFNIVDDERVSLKGFVYFMKTIIVSLPENYHIIINRDGQTFACVVLDEGTFLIMDSHIQASGWVTIDGLIQYILYGQGYMGTIEVLYQLKRS